jgi:recombination protein RecT
MMLAHEGKDNQMGTSVIQLPTQPHALPVIPEPVGLPEAIAKAFTEAMNEVVNLIQSPLVAKRFATVALTKLRTQPDLQLCTPMSLIAVFVEAAEAGLDISGQNECFLIPYKNRDKNGRIVSVEAQMQLGYAGLMKLAVAHPDVLDVWAEKVCALDTWRYRGINQRPEHTYPEAFAPRGATVGFYALAELVGGRVRCLQMSVTEMKAHAQNYSRNAEKKVWSDGPGGGFEGMALKTMLRRICNPKMIPMSARVADILYKMDVVEGLIVPEPAEETLETVEAHAREVAKSVEEHIGDMFPPATNPTQPPVRDPREVLRENIDELLDSEGVSPAQQQRWRVAMAKKYQRESYGDLSAEQYRAIITSLLEAAEQKEMEGVTTEPAAVTQAVAEGQGMLDADHDETCTHDEPALPLAIPPQGWREELRHLASNTLEVVVGAKDKAFEQASIKTCEVILRLCDNPTFTDEEAREQTEALVAIGRQVSAELGF